MLWAVPEGIPGVPALTVQGFPAIQSFPSCPMQQEPGAKGPSELILAGPSPSPSRGEAAEGEALTGDGPSSWHLPDLGPIIPWQLSSGSKEGRAVFKIPMPFLSLPFLHLFYVRAGLTLFHVPLLGRSILLQLDGTGRRSGTGMVLMDTFAFSIPEQQHEMDRQMDRRIDGWTMRSSSTKAQLPKTLFLDIVPTSSREKKGRTGFGSVRLQEQSSNKLNSNK